MRCPSTPEKPQHTSGIFMEAALPQQWRHPAAMVLAASALLLCAPYLWGRSGHSPVPVVVSRRHLQQPGVQSQQSGRSVWHLGSVEVEQHTCL